MPLITQPTRFSSCTSKQSLIDNIFTNTFTYESNSGNILIEIADHLAQFASIHKNISPITKETHYKLDKSKFNETQFLDDLSIQNFDHDSPDPNEKFTNLLWRYESCVKRHMPLKKLNKQELKLKKKPWLTKVILNKIKHRNDIFAKKKRDPNNEHLQHAYNCFRNSVNRDIKNSNREITILNTLKIAIMI